MQHSPRFAGAIGLTLLLGGVAVVVASVVSGGALTGQTSGKPRNLIGVPQTGGTSSAAAQAGAGVAPCSEQDPRIACLSQIVGATPKFGTNLDGSVVVFYDKAVSDMQPFLNGLQTCGSGLEMLRPGNFGNAAIQQAMSPRTPVINDGSRGAFVQGPCSSAMLSQYQNAGIPLTNDITCNQPGLAYNYSTLPSGSPYTGISDKGDNSGWPAAVCYSQAIDPATCSCDIDGPWNVSQCVDTAPSCPPGQVVSYPLEPVSCVRGACNGKCYSCVNGGGGSSSGNNSSGAAACPFVCGDGMVVAGEECDNGGQNSDTVANRCRTDCRNAHCGDGAKDTGEQCDDGNTVGGDSCPANCGMGGSSSSGNSSSGGPVVCGGSTTEYGLTGVPYDIATGPDGNLWVAVNEESAIAKVTTSGVITKYPIPTANSGPREIVEGPDGNLWFTQFPQSEIGKITTAGSTTEFPIASAARGITAGSDGNIWFSAGNQIGKMTPAGVATYYPVTGAFPLGMTLGADGNVWFSASATTPSIGKITPVGSVTLYPISGLNSGASLGDKLVADSGGNIWFAVQQEQNSPYAPAIGKITTGGNATTYDIHPFGPNYDIIVGPDDNIWFGIINAGMPKIGRMTLGGTFTEFDSGGLIFGLANGPDGNIWFTRLQGDIVGKLGVPCPGGSSSSAGNSSSGAGQCGNDQTDSGEQCGEPGLACPAGQSCDACVCSGGGMCGNGNQDALEQCGEPRLTCPSGQSCGNCLCSGISLCGNDQVDSGEQCGEPGLSCSGSLNCSNCRCSVNGFCGNNKIDQNEECDDGNTAAGDGCDGTCQLENEFCALGS